MDNTNKARFWPNRSFEFYLDALNSADNRVRRQAIAALEIIGDSRAVLPIVALANDSSSEIRGNVARALGKLGDPQAIPVLAQLSQDEVGEVRRYAVDALSKFNNPAIIEPLVAVLNDPYTSDQALRTLGKLRDERTVEPLLQVLTENQPYAMLAAIALGQIGQPVLLPLLDLLQDSDNERVRHNAAIALACINDIRASKAVENYTEMASPEFRRDIEGVLLQRWQGLI